MDAQNRRVGKSINGVHSKFWVYESQLKITAELDGSGQVVSRFIYGRGHSPEAMIKNGVAYKLVSDHLGSVRFVVNSATGEIAQRIEYDEFGRVLSDTNPGFQPFGFAGGLYDLDTKLVRFGARDYDPEVGRWTSKDPILFAGGDTNLYGYVAQDPINWIDPTGLKTTLYNSGIHQVIAIDSPSSPTGKTYIDLVPGNSSNIGIISPSPAAVGISSTYIGDPLTVAATYNTSPLQEAELLNMAAAYNLLAQMGIYKYQTFPFGGSNVGNCRSFADDLLRGVGAK